MHSVQLERIAPVKRASYVVLPDGRIQVDPAKKDIVPFWLTTEPEEITVPAAIEMCQGKLAGGIVEQPVAMPIDNKGPFEVVYSSFNAIFTAGPNVGQPTDQFTVIIFDPEFRPLLMNREIHARTIGGGFGSSPFGNTFGSGAIPSAGGRPFVWPETFFMEPTLGGKALFMGFRNLNTYPIKIRWTFAGVRYYHLRSYERAIREKECVYGKGRISWPYWYTTDTDVRLLGGESREFDIRMTDEADVEIVKMTHFSDFPFLWRLQEKAGKRFLDSSGPGVGGVIGGVHSDFGWGDGEFPFIPFESLYLERNYKLILQLSNSLTSNANRIFATLSCRKIAYAPSA